MKGVQDFLRGTLIHSSNYGQLPTTAFYAWENVQPKPFQVDGGIAIAVNPQRMLLIPIVPDLEVFMKEDLLSSSH
jgi:hypothetical protein